MGEVNLLETKDEPMERKILGREFIKVLQINNNKIWSTKGLLRYSETAG